MSSLKLLHSGGNGVIISAPSSNPASNRTITVPGNADGEMLTTTNPKAGNIIQVKQTVKTSFQSLATKDVVTDVTSVAITPSSTSSKILVMVCGDRGDSNGNTFGALYLSRVLSGSTTDLVIGDSRGASTRCSISATKINGDAAVAVPFGIQFLDSPSTTSECTYKLRMENLHDGTMCIGGTFNSSADDNRTSVPTIITAMEVAA